MYAHTFCAISGSTSILTPEEEMIVIPNKLIASSEIWNYTKGSNIVVQKVHIGISYGSDWRLAEKLILKVVNKHPYVMKTPKANVRMLGFGDSSINLELWMWIIDARDMEQISSDVYEMIKDIFDENGIEIPYPYRTVVYKNDLPPEAKFPDNKKFKNIRLYPSRGREYYEKADLMNKTKAVENPRIHTCWFRQAILKLQVCLQNTQ